MALMKEGQLRLRFLDHLLIVRVFCPLLLCFSLLSLDHSLPHSSPRMPEEEEALSPQGGHAARAELCGVDLEVIRNHGAALLHQGRRLGQGQRPRGVHVFCNRTERVLRLAGREVDEWGAPGAKNTDGTAVCEHVGSVPASSFVLITRCARVRACRCLPTAMYVWLWILLRPAGKVSH